MKIYKVRKSKFAGTDYREVYRRAFLAYKKLRARTKRTPYVRSAYFEGDKIFITFFWDHLQGKSWKDRMRRLKYFECAIDLIVHSKFPPVSKQNPNSHQEILHRFGGITADEELFYIQIKEDKKSDKKWLMSVFPEKD